MIYFVSLNATSCVFIHLDLLQQGTPCLCATAAFSRPKGTMIFCINVSNASSSLLVRAWAYFLYTLRNVELLKE